MSGSQRQRSPVSQVEVEEKIARLTDRLEEAVEVYEERAEAAASEEALWRLLFDSAVLDVEVSSRRASDADARKAQARQLCRDRGWVARALASLGMESLVPADPDQLRVHLIADARADAAKETLRSVQSQLSAQQTLLRSLSNLT